MFVGCRCFATKNKKTYAPNKKRPTQRTGSSPTAKFAHEFETHLCKLSEGLSTSLINQQSPIKN